METASNHLALRRRAGSFPPFLQGPRWRIGIVATRLAGVDGVTLETRKWARTLRAMGHQVFYLAGALDPDLKPGWVDALFHFQHPLVQRLHRAFYDPHESLRLHGILDWFERLAHHVQARLAQFVRAFGIQVLIVQNALAIPMHIPLAMGITWFLERNPLPTIAHHHDFFWERERFRTARLPGLLEAYFPPALPNVVHVVINRAAARALQQRKGLPSTLVPNVWDFSTPPPRGDAARLLRRLGFGPEDILILQPTRVVPRKGIEHALELLHRLTYGPWQRHLKGRRPVLVISHPAGDEGWTYLHHLQRRAEALRVPLLYLADNGRRGPRISPWTLYAHAHAMTYPSLYEGFGNALLEGLHYGLPILVNRYPVYREDIASHAFRLVEMDGAVTPEVVDAFAEHLLDPKLRQAHTAHNRAVAQQAFGIHVLYQALHGLLRQMRLA